MPQWRRSWPKLYFFFSSSFKSRQMVLITLALRGGRESYANKCATVTMTMLMLMLMLMLHYQTSCDQNEVGKLRRVRQYGHAEGPKILAVCFGTPFLCLCQFMRCGRAAWRWWDGTACTCTCTCGEHSTGAAYLIGPNVRAIVRGRPTNAGNSKK